MLRLPALVSCGLRTVVDPTAALRSAPDPAPPPPIETRNPPRPCLPLSTRGVAGVAVPVSG